MEVAPKRTRCDNFTQEEELLFLECIRKYMDILGNTATNNITKMKKDNAWETITMNYNLLNDRERTSQQLRVKFNSMKKLSRKYVIERSKSTTYKYNEVFEEFLTLRSIKHEASSTTSDPLTIQPKTLDSLDSIQTLDSLDSIQSGQIKVIHVQLRSPNPNQVNNIEGSSVENLWEVIESGSEDTDNEYQETANGCQEIENGGQEIENIHQDITNDHQYINNGHQNINNGQQNINNGHRNINNGHRNINIGHRNINIGHRVIKKRPQDIENGRRVIRNGHQDNYKGCKDKDLEHRNIKNALKGSIAKTIHQKRSRLLELEIQEKILKMDFEKELRKKQLQLMDLEIELKKKQLEHVDDDDGSP